MKNIKPSAWAVFSENGNMRLWSTDSDPVRKLADREDVELVPLYKIPTGPTNLMGETDEAN